MNDGNEQMQVEFHNNATAIFFRVCAAFEQATSGLSRQTGEQGFQHAKKQYAEKLDQELQEVAKNVLGKHKRERQSNRLDPMFHQFIQDYLHRFVQKANAL